MSNMHCSDGDARHHGVAPDEDAVVLPAVPAPDMVADHVYHDPKPLAFECVSNASSECVSETVAPTIPESSDEWTTVTRRTRSCVDHSRSRCTNPISSDHCEPSPKESLSNPDPEFVSISFDPIARSSCDQIPIPHASESSVDPCFAPTQIENVFPYPANNLGLVFLPDFAHYLDQKKRSVQEDTTKSSTLPYLTPVTLKHVKASPIYLSNYFEVLSSDDDDDDNATLPYNPVAFAENPRWHPGTSAPTSRPRNDHTRRAPNFAARPREHGSTTKSCRDNRPTKQPKGRATKFIGLPTKRHQYNGPAQSHRQNQSLSIGTTNQHNLDDFETEFKKVVRHYQAMLAPYHHARMKQRSPGFDRFLHTLSIILSELLDFFRMTRLPQNVHFPEHRDRRGPSYAFTVETIPQQPPTGPSERPYANEPSNTVTASTEPNPTPITPGIHSDSALEQETTPSTQTFQPSFSRSPLGSDVRICESS